MSEQEFYFKRLKDMKLKNPILIGFGIKDKATFTRACQFANGAIIGSAYIQALKDPLNIEANTSEFVQTLL